MFDSLVMIVEAMTAATCRRERVRTVALLQRQSIVAGEGKTSDRPIDGLQLQDGKTSVDHIVQLYISTQLCRCVSYSYFLQPSTPAWRDAHQKYNMKKRLILWHRII
jgi:hypothetical protein